MDKQPLKVAAIVGVIALAVAGLVYSMRAVSKNDEYAPSPGGQATAGSMAEGKAGQSSAPGMPGGPPAGRVPGSAR